VVSQPVHGLIKVADRPVRIRQDPDFGWLDLLELSYGLHVPLNQASQIGDHGLDSLEKHRINIIGRERLPDRLQAINKRLARIAEVFQLDLGLIHETEKAKRVMRQDAHDWSTPGFWQSRD
jgi:hypothetical protein